MIPEYKRFHGSVLAEIIDSAECAVTIQALDPSGRLLNYILNGNIGVQIKYATQRLHPWLFTFPAHHVEALAELEKTCEATFLVLVCNSDGMLAVQARDVLPLLFETTESGQSWLRVDRRKREQYRLYGPTGEFPKKFPITLDPVMQVLVNAPAETLE